MFESAVKAINNLTKQTQNPDKYWKEKVDKIYKEVLEGELKSKSRFHIFIK